MLPESVTETVIAQIVGGISCHVEKIPDEQEGFIQDRLQANKVQDVQAYQRSFDFSYPSVET